MSARIVDGYHGDSAWTYAVGSICDEAQRLLDVTEASLYLGIEQARAGNRLGAIGHAVEAVRHRLGATDGARIRRSRHRPGDVGGPACSQPRRSPDPASCLRAGMTLAIEPMLNVGGDETDAAGRRLDGDHARTDRCPPTSSTPS